MRQQEGGAARDHPQPRRPFSFISLGSPRPYKAKSCYPVKLAGVLVTGRWRERTRTVFYRAPTYQVGAAVGWSQSGLCPEPFPAQVKPLQQEPRGRWRKMWSDQLSDVVIIMIAAIPLWSVSQPLAYITSSVLRGSWHCPYYTQVDAQSLRGKGLT